MAESEQTVATNRRARFEYHLEEVYEAGLVLTGTEVKSLRAGRATLGDAFARVERDEVWLYHMHIPPMKGATSSTTIRCVNGSSSSTGARFAASSERFRKRGTRSCHCACISSAGWRRLNLRWREESGSMTNAPPSRSGKCGGGWSVWCADGDR